MDFFTKLTDLRDKIGPVFMFIQDNEYVKLEVRRNVSVRYTPLVYESTGTDIREEVDEAWDALIFAKEALEEECARLRKELNELKGK